VYSADFQYYSCSFIVLLSWYERRSIGVPEHVRLLAGYRNGQVIRRKPASIEPLTVIESTAVMNLPAKVTVYSEYGNGKRENRLSPPDDL
jgi:hypothetical protein